MPIRKWKRPVNVRFDRTLVRYRKIAIFTCYIIGFKMQK